MRFKLILCCFLTNISPYTKSHSNRKKNAEVKNFRHWLVLVGRASRSKNGRWHFKLILCGFWSIISPHTKFHPNQMENTEVENFRYKSILVGQAGRHLKTFYVVFVPLLAPTPNFIQIRWKTQNENYG